MQLLNLIEKIDSMKALFVTGGDYAALHFANEFAGTPAEEIIEKLGRYQSYSDMIEDAEEIHLEVVMIGSPSKVFIDCVRELQDYDYSKQKNFWLENETI